MTQLATLFPDFKQTCPKLELKEGVEFESFAKVEPDLWEIKRAFDNGYERAAIFHRGELYHHQWNFYQSGVKNMPISAIIHAQGLVIAAGKDVQTTLNDLEGLNVLARMAIAKLDMDDQGRAQEWAARKFDDVMEATDEFYHTCMGWLGHELNAWQHTNGIKISQRVLWGIRKVAFTVSFKHEDDSIEFNRSYDFLSDFLPQAKAMLDEFTTALLTLGWIDSKPVGLDLDRLRKERILRNQPAYLRSREAVLSTLTSDCRTAESFADLPPAMREQALEAARNINVEDAYPKDGEQAGFERLSQLIAKTKVPDNEREAHYAEIARLEKALGVSK